MKTKWIDNVQTYDGTQLRSLYAYLQHQVMGPSTIAWRGPCEVDFSHMVDGEDLLAKEKICGSDMVHFIIEIFDQPLLLGVFAQRFFASIVTDVLREMAPALKVRREGDDIYFNEGKFSISIATRSTSSVLIHFAVNVSNEGTPVKTSALNDLHLDPKTFAQKCLQKWQTEFETSLAATWKVRSVE